MKTSISKKFGQLRKGVFHKYRDFFKKLVTLSLVFLFLLSMVSPVFAELSLNTVDNDASAPASGPSVKEATPSDDINSSSDVNVDQLDPVAQNSTQADSLTNSSANSSIKATDLTAANSSMNSSGNIGDSPKTEVSNSPRELSPDIDKNSGALIYNYSLDIPNGRNKLQPDLKLNYNSQNFQVDGVFGFSWSLNIPYIQLVNKVGSDKLYSTSTPTYFISSVDGELATTTDASIYAARIENGSFNKYSFSNNHWLVTSKDGTQYKYGYTAATQQNDPNNTSHIYKWMLEEVRDTNNNYISYSYYKDAGQIYPASIKYTGNGSTDGIFEIDFIRTARTDNAQSSSTGFPVSTNYLINEIDVKINSTITTKYLLSYASGGNSSKSLLSSIARSGIIDGNTITLPSTSFTYQHNTNSGWTASSSLALPVGLYSNGHNAGWQIADINGDGLPDIFSSYDSNNSITSTVYINNGHGWTQDTSWTIPVAWYTSGALTGWQIADINGDGLPDIFSSYDSNNSITSTVYINNGHGWTQDTSWTIPVAWYTSGALTGWQIADINGDGLPDIFLSSDYNNNVTSTVYINNGHGWTQDTSWTIPVGWYTNGLVGWQLADINGDGLPDIFLSSDYNNNVTSTVYINNGHGWTQDTSWTIPVGWYTNGGLTGWQLADINGDGLPDIFLSSDYNNNVTSNVYINNGHGWTHDTSWTLPMGIYVNGYDSGYKILDINGDGLPDIMTSNLNFDNSIYSSVYINNPPTNDLLSKITYSQGGSTQVVYKPVAQYTDASNVLVNNSPYFPQYTVSQLGQNDGFNNIATSTYQYQGASYYYADPYTKKFAGFNLVISNDPEGNVTKTYYHTGNGADSAHGEYQDNYWKINQPYRVEQYDSNGNLYKKIINKWDVATTTSSSLVGFVKLTQAVTSDYNGVSSHKDKTEGYIYSNTTGNQTQKISYGQVNGNDDGTFSDIGSDDFTTNTSYASSTSSNILSMPSDVVVTDHNNNKVKESKYYYDNQSLGSLGSNGNKTKEENWKSGSTYINTQKTYNSYGLVTQDKDARGKNTNYVYDSYNLYVATSTNALNQSTQYYYNYYNGKPTKTIDPNNRIFETVYDGLNRAISESQPDIDNPTATTTKDIYQYTDIGLPKCIQKTSYLNSATSTVSFTYLDGLNRTIQQRNQAEDNNTFSVKDSSYNKNGLLFKESLPYFSIGASSTVATSTNYLYSTYLYDPLNRIKLSSNSVGTTTYAYSDWKTTVTDPLNHQKDLYKDAYDNLIQVGEHNGADIYNTFYEYNLLGNLTKITDALNNVRNFNYDALGRLLKSEDLHATVDTTFGSSTLVYDDAGNLITKTNPNNQIINYAYDDIGRPLSEDYTGQAGTEVSYGYDSCTDGIGRLCTATTTSVITNYSYNPLGLVKTESKNISGNILTTQYGYDRQGNITLLTYPDNGLVKYDYNSSGLIEKISKKEDGQSNYVDVISDYDYNPLGQVSYSLSGNNAVTYDYYDPSQLYRLEHKFTIFPDYGYDGSGIRNLSALRVNSDNTITPASDAARKFNNAMSKLSALSKSQKMKKSAGATAFEASSSVQANKSLSTNTLSNNPPNQSTNLLTEGLWLTETMTNNDGFENGLDDWTFYSANGATGSSDCTTAYSGVCSAKISVATSSPDWWNTLLFQQVRLDAGVNYTIKFKAKAATSTSVMMSVGQNHDPYYILGLEKYVNIGTTWKTYSYSFTANSTDLAARILLGFGEHASAYWIDDFQLVPDNLNQIKNSGFENGFSDGWQFWSYGGDASSTNAAICSTSSEGDCSDYTNIHQAGENWQIQLSQPMSVSSSNTYVLTFYAKASSSRVIHPALTQSHDPWGDLTPTMNVSVGTSWAKYSVELTPSATDSNARLMFYLGDYAPGFYLDDVHLWVKQNTKLTTSQPNFSAIYADPDASDASPYYQIQLIEKRGNFLTPLWDSGKTAMTSTTVGNRIPNIPYNGSTISAWDGKIYYWRIKLWDATGAEGPWTNGRDYFQMYGNTIQDINYTYDSNGNITHIFDKSYTDAAKTMDYAYDDLNRLTIASSTTADNHQNYIQTCSYNAIGDILNKSDVGNYLYNGNSSASYANPHAATSINNSSASYDRAGNLTSDGAWTNTWNYNNRLISSTNGSITIQYAYDQNGNRVSYSVGGVTTIIPNKYYDTKGATSTKYIYNGSNLVATIEKNASTTNIYYNHNDNLSGSNVITNASSSVVELLDYYPFGGIRLDEKTGSFNEKKKFTSHDFDSDTGLNYMGARYQNGNTGRFISEDPAFWAIGDNSKFKAITNQDLNLYLSDPQKLNSYSYVENNPISKIDPTGQSSWMSWITKTLSTAFQVGVWSLGSSLVGKSNVLGVSRPASSALMEHSLSINPQPINIDQNNQDSYGNIINEIQGSNEYKSLLSGLMQANSETGVISYNQESKNYSPLEFESSSGDLFSALHGTTGTDIQGTKNQNNVWNFSVNITDIYDYKLQSSRRNYRDGFLFNSLNNAAYFSQNYGAISKYGINIQFNQQKGGGWY